MEDELQSEYLTGVKPYIAQKPIISYNGIYTKWENLPERQRILYETPINFSPGPALARKLKAGELRADGAYDSRTFAAKGGVYNADNVLYGVRTNENGEDEYVLVTPDTPQKDMQGVKSFAVVNPKTGLPPSYYFANGTTFVRNKVGDMRQNLNSKEVIGRQLDDGYVIRPEDYDSILANQIVNGYVASLKNFNVTDKQLRDAGLSNGYEDVKNHVRNGDTRALLNAAAAQRRNEGKTNIGAAFNSFNGIYGDMDTYMPEESEDLLRQEKFLRKNKPNNSGYYFVVDQTNPTTDLSSPHVHSDGGDLFSQAHLFANGGSMESTDKATLAKSNEESGNIINGKPRPVGLSAQTQKAFGNIKTGEDGEEFQVDNQDFITDMIFGRNSAREDMVSLIKNGNLTTERAKYLLGDKLFNQYISGLLTKKSDTGAQETAETQAAEGEANEYANGGRMANAKNPDYINRGGSRMRRVGESGNYDLYL